MEIACDRSEHVVRTAPMVPMEADRPDGVDRFVFLGRDQHGVPLEVAAIEVDETLLVIHAMKVRHRYIAYYREHTDE